MELFLTILMVFLAFTGLIFVFFGAICYGVMWLLLWPIHLLLVTIQHWRKECSCEWCQRAIH